MNDKHSNSDNEKQVETVSEILHEMGDGLVTVAALPGEIVYKTIMKFFEFLGDGSILLAKSLKCVFKGSVNVHDTLYQMATIGVASLPIILITVAFSGAVLSLYMAQIVVKWGMGGYTGAVVALSITREIAPVLTAVVVTARSGSAIAAELGSMKVTEQIDALRALAVNPIEYLVVPRLLAAIIMLPVLGVIADVVGTYAGYLVAIVNGVAGGSFVNSVKYEVSFHDVYMGLVKTAFFAVVIVIVGAQQGFQTKGGATGVGKSTTAAVVISIVVIYILNFFLAYVMFGGKTAFL